MACPAETAFLKAAARAARKEADQYAARPALTYARNVHNEHLIRAIEVQKKVMALLVQWEKTGKEKYRRAVIAYIRMIGAWKYWSWITWRQGNARPDAIFDLSYGENSATLGIAYDWLYHSLSKTEKALFLKIARHWSFKAGRKFTRPGNTWWFGRADSNWNTVCAGGLGMLCLALYEEAPEARYLLTRVEASIRPYYKHLDRQGGGWSEGVGYWDYGMSYGFRYLLSWEGTFGRKHPLLKLAGVKQTLAFPLDFSCNGQPCGYSDGNMWPWQPLPFHFALARRLRDRGVLRRLQSLLPPVTAFGNQRDQRACTGEWLAVRPQTPGRQAAGKTRTPFSKLYRGLDWGILADRQQDPEVYITFRGGTTKVPHEHRDLLSFHYLLKGECLLSNLVPGEYLDTTFSPRRHELFEMTPAAKNTILINGVGIVTESTLESTRLVRLPGAVGVRLEATRALGSMRDGLAVRFCGRLILLLGKALLVIDRAVLPHVGRMESRAHTYARVKAGGNSVRLLGRKQSARVTYASSVPALVRTAVSAPTTPTQQAAVSLRWCTRLQHKDITMATLVTPGTAMARVKIAGESNGMRISVQTRGFGKIIRVTKKLTVKK